MPEFTKVEVPRGQFWGWAVKPPQEVTVKAVSYDPTGGTDANDKPVPRLIGTLLEPTTSYRDKGTTPVKMDAGELVTIEGGVANVKSGLLAADPQPGDIVKLVFSDTYDTTKGGKGSGKQIDVFIARGSSGAVSEDDV
jgi:hypothetical protein